MTRLERKLPVGERCDVIAARFVRERQKPKCSVVLEQMRLQGSIARRTRRRELLLSEVRDWEAAVCDYGGVMDKIAARMGCAPDTARFALWDLGLWSAVVAARRDRVRTRGDRSPVS